MSSIKKYAGLIYLTLFTVIFAGCPTPEPTPAPIPVPIENEGSKASPIVLTIDTIRNNCQIGKTSLNQTKSYYKFDTPSAGDYDFTISNSSFLNQNFEYRLFSDAGFSVSHGPMIATTSSPVFRGLGAGATNYLEITNLTNTEKVTFSAMFSIAAMNHEGSTLAPIDVTLNSDYSGKSGSSTYIGDTTSFYKFTTSAAGSYQITLDSPTPANDYTFILYTNAGFTTQKSTSTNDGGYISTGLLASTTYYLKIINAAGIPGTYTLKVASPGNYTTNNEGEPGLPQGLSINGIYGGKVGATSDTIAKSSYYSFSTLSGYTDFSLAVGTIVSSNANLEYALYSDIDFTTLISTYSTDAGFTRNELTGSTTYYLKVTNLGTGTATFNLTTSGALTVFYNEGEPGTPILLSINGVYGGKATTNTIAKSSYYSFTTLSGYTDFSLAVSSIVSTNANLEYALYSDINFTTLISTYSTDAGFTRNELTGSTTYYLKVTNLGTGTATFNLTTTGALTTFYNEGSIASPISLTLETTRNGAKVGATGTVSQQQYSYYSFPVTYSGNYTLAVNTVSPVSNLDYTVYSDAAFTTVKATITADAGGSLTSLAAQTYYLKVTNTTTNKPSFNLTLTRDQVAVTGLTGSESIITGSLALTLNWTAIPGASGYKVFKSTTIGGTYNLVDSPVSNSTILTPGVSETVLFYKVSAIVNSTDWPLSSATSAFIYGPNLVSLAYNTKDITKVLAAGGTVWYKISGISGQRYYIQFGDKNQNELSSTFAYSANIKMTVFQSDGTSTYFSGVDNGYSAPMTFIAASTGYIYIKVDGFNTTEAGTFWLKYYTPSLDIIIQ